MRAAAWSKLFQPVHNRGGSLAYTEQTIMETELTNKKPGSTIDSWCGKCKMVLAHTIEAMVGDKPVRVHCNTCNAVHTYKAKEPGKTAAPGKARPSRYQALIRGSDMSAAKTYSPKGKYEPGDVLQHP